MASSTPSIQPSVATVSPIDAQKWLESKQAALIDVREPDEHASERIAGAVLLPLSRFDVGKAGAVTGARTKLVLHCKGGKRSADAARLAGDLRTRGIDVYSMTGGIEAWKQAGLPVATSSAGPRISVMRQVQLTVGVLVLAGVALGWKVHPAFLGVPAFMGAGLILAGASGTCGLATVLGVMPWNRVAGASCEVKR